MSKKTITLEIGKGVKNQKYLVENGFRNTANKYSELEESLDRKISKLRKLKSTDGIIEAMSFTDSEKKQLSEFVKEYCSLSETEVSEKLAKSVLIIGKSTFENVDDIVIDNELYQKLLKRYIDNGHEEPFAHMIAGTSRVKKSTEFSTLVNNLNKGYTIFKTDELPKGVSKDNNTSIEEFLEESYKAIGLGKEKEISIEISPKLDGVSVNAAIVNGKFETPLSRGDSDGSILLKGLEGYTISTNPEIVKHKKFGAQYEAFMPYANKEKLLDVYGIEYKSARGAANGVVMKSAKPETFDVEQKEYLAFYPIDVEGIDFPNIYEKEKFLEKMYVGPNDMINRVVTKGNFDTLLKGISAAFKKYNEIRDTLSYAIDGIVITILEDKIIEALGRKGRKNMYQIALKFEPKRGIGIIKDISFSTGKKGYKTIMAELEHPVSIDEKDFTKVSIGSLDKFDELDLHYGDKVEIVHVGDAMVGINKVTNVKHVGDKIVLPEYCPSCGAKLSITNSRIMCNNNDCRDYSIGKILNFLNVINVIGYSEKSALKLYSKGICTISDLLCTTNEMYDYALPNGHILKEKIISALKKCDEADALTGLGVLDLGRETAIKILRKSSIKELCEDFDINVLGAKIKTVPGIGDSIYKILSDINDEKDTLIVLSKYIKNKVIINDAATKIATTSVSSATKSSVKEFIKNNPDYTFVDSKSFDILIVDDYKVKSGKMSAAEKRGLKPNEGIYTFDDFIKLTKGENEKIKNERIDNNINNEEVVDETKVTTGTIPNITSIDWSNLVRNYKYENKLAQ